MVACGFVFVDPMRSLGTSGEHAQLAARGGSRPAHAAAAFAIWRLSNSLFAGNIYLYRPRSHADRRVLADAEPICPATALARDSLLGRAVLERGLHTGLALDRKRRDRNAHRRDLHAVFRWRRVVVSAAAQL